MKTAEQYIESIRELNATVYLFGKKVKSVPDDPILRPSLDAVARTYQMTTRPEYEDLMTDTSHLTGEKISRFTHVPMSVDDLVKKVRMVRLLASRIATCFQRCGGLDGMITMYHTTYEVDQQFGTQYHQRFRKWLEYMQKEDLFPTAGVMDPKGDRSLRPADQADKDLYLRVVEERQDGVVVCGAKAHQTGLTNAHELLVIPCRAMREHEKEYAIAFAVPSNTKGVTHIVGRQSCDTRRLESCRMDWGNVRYACVEGLTVFDHVFVPWDRVFLHGETQAPVRAMEIFGGTHRITSGGGCVVGSYDVWIGAAALVAEYNGLKNVEHIKHTISKMILDQQAIMGCAMDAAWEGAKAPSGGYLNNMLMGNVTKYLSSQTGFEMLKYLNEPAGGLPLTMPSEEDLRSKEIGQYVEKYLKGKAEVPTEYRMRIMRLIENMSVGNNHRLGELHGAGSPQTQIRYAYETCNLEYLKHLAKVAAGIEEEEELSLSPKKNGRLSKVSK